MGRNVWREAPMWHEDELMYEIKLKNGDPRPGTYDPGDTVRGVAIRKNTDEVDVRITCKFY